MYWHSCFLHLCLIVSHSEETEGRIYTELYCSSRLPPHELNRILHKYLVLSPGKKYLDKGLTFSIYSYNLHIYKTASPANRFNPNKFIHFSRSPKKGLVNADFNWIPARLSTAKSTLSQGRNRNLASSIFSNPQSSRNSTPPSRLPTLLCSISRTRDNEYMATTFHL